MRWHSCTPLWMVRWCESCSKLMTCEKEVMYRHIKVCKLLWWCHKCWDGLCRVNSRSCNAGYTRSFVGEGKESQQMHQRLHEEKLLGNNVDGAKTFVHLGVQSWGKCQSWVCRREHRYDIIHIYSPFAWFDLNWTVFDRNPMAKFTSISGDATKIGWQRKYNSNRQNGDTETHEKTHLKQRQGQDVTQKSVEECRHLKCVMSKWYICVR